MNKNFINFNLAKKLKNRGFHEECCAYYTSKGEFYYEEAHEGDTINNLFWEPVGSSIGAPTISQVLYWLREIMEIYVIIEPFPSHSTPNKIIWGWSYKWKSDGQNMLTEDPDENTYLEYTDAAQACFNYILDNLIHEVVWQQGEDY